MMTRPVDWVDLRREVGSFRRHVAARHHRLLVLWTIPSVPDFRRYNARQGQSHCRELTIAAMERASRTFHQEVQVLKKHLGAQEGPLETWDWACMVYGDAMIGIRRCLTGSDRSRLAFPEGATYDGFHPRVVSRTIERALRDQIERVRRAARQSRAPRPTPVNAENREKTPMDFSAQRASDVTAEAQAKGAVVRATLRMTAIRFVGQEAMQLMQEVQANRLGLQ